ncbi:hypothetical protein AXG93_1129s1240 [Marchantia polymorpha subsp. ruderalis]|uniref:Uncharacterized protein n=1 Tax=Marchantia polymorpha subsp. ruderalis TaxID=1480154 RepID=A0A176W2U0_MARPO|nr:hypothetical protein AXG93_1129s1240 [Marchantia polymorpha subsp. ruderalis]
MVREWLKGKDQPTRGFRPHPERWEVCDWEQVLGRCAGEEGHLLFESESIKVTKEEEISFGTLFKSSKSSKNGWRSWSWRWPELRFIGLAFYGRQRDNMHSRRREYRSITSPPS